MTSFPITEESVKQLLEKKLYDSAEYWSSLLLQEKNLEPVDSCNRYLLYADCLYHNQKYEHAAYYYQHALSIINSLLSHVEQKAIQSKIFFQLYLCEYMGCDDKTNRTMLQKCILYLEEIDTEFRTVEIRMHLARLYWAMNHYTKAQEAALSVLKEEPLAIEAIDLLSRIRDYKGLRQVEIEEVVPQQHPTLTMISTAELNKYSNPHESILLYNQLNDLLIPSPTFTLQIAICYLSLHQIRSFLQSIELLHYNDPSNQHKPFYILATLLSQMNNLSYSHPSIPITLTELPTYLSHFKQQMPFHLVSFMMECYLCRERDLSILEQHYWNLINHFPSYTSYFLLIQFYLDEGMHPKAMTLATQLQKNNPHSVYTNLLLARVYLSLPTGSYQAELHLRKCLEMDPTQREVVYLLAKLLYEKGDFKQAIELLGSVLAEDISTEMKQLLCECYLKNGDMIPYLKLLHTLFLVCFT